MFSPPPQWPSSISRRTGEADGDEKEKKDGEAEPAFGTDAEAAGDGE